MYLRACPRGKFIIRREGEDMGQKEKIQVKNIADLEVLLINDIRIKYGIQVLNIKKMELMNCKMLRDKRR